MDVVHTIIVQRVKISSLMRSYSNSHDLQIRQITQTRRYKFNKNIEYYKLKMEVMSSQHCCVFWKRNHTHVLQHYKNCMHKEFNIIVANNLHPSTCCRLVLKPRANKHNLFHRRHLSYISSRQVGAPVVASQHGRHRSPELPAIQQVAANCSIS